MSQTSINIRTDDELKRQFDELCGQLGLTLSTAINIFMKASVRERRIPVSLSLEPPAKRPRSLDEYTEEELSASFAKSEADHAAGRFRPVEDVFSELDRKYDL